MTQILRKYNLNSNSKNEVKKNSEIKKLKNEEEISRNLRDKLSFTLLNFNK